jgi:hypothetical protein
MLTRRLFLIALGAASVRPVAVRGQSEAEVLVAAIQDGGKTIYLRTLPTERVDAAARLGRALQALRVPLNDILASAVAGARTTAEMAFGADRVRVSSDLAHRDGIRRLIGTPAGPGMNRVLIGDRGGLEMAVGRAFPDGVLPEGAMAVFLPERDLPLVGMITAERVIASAERRGALTR